MEYGPHEGVLHILRRHKFSQCNGMKDDSQLPTGPLIFTGMGEEEYRDKIKEQVPHCYLCKRGRGEGSVLVLEGERKVKYRPLKVGDVSTNLGGLEVAYHLCYECFILLSKIAPTLGEQMIGEDWKA
jgi:hypothetical protein